jgi:hypothetical protein
MSSWFKGIGSKKSDKQKADAKARAILKAKREEVCKRQTNLLAAEVNLEWRLVFDTGVPSKKKDTFVIKNVTRRNVWMETDFLYNQIKSFNPDQLFHRPEKYALQWQPRGSMFRLIIPLNDPQVQENAIIIMSQFSKRERKRILFFFAPIDPAMPMYAERVHPASLVSYRTKNQVLKKLCDYFLLDRISVEEIQAVLMCDQYIWSATLFNLLPEDEQVYHMYLSEQKPLDDTKKSIAKSYIDGDITLEAYEDAKFPDRKKLREIEAASYPAPYEKGICTICTKENAGIVSCHTCDNMVCESCMLSLFSGKHGRKSISFLLMHQKFCMKLGELPPITPEVSGEQGYLREFRSCSRIVALEKLLPKRKTELQKEDELSEDEEDAENKRREEEERQRAAAEEAARLAQSNPPALRALKEQLPSRVKKLERLRKDIAEYTERAQDKSHTEQFNARNLRLRNEAIEKLRATVQVHLEKIEQQARALNLEGPFIEDLLATVADLQQQCAVASADLAVVVSAPPSPPPEPASPTITVRRNAIESPSLAGTRKRVNS